MKIISLLLLTISLQSFAVNKVAKAILVRGNVKAKFSGKIITIKKGVWVNEGAIIQTAKRSFVKFLFIDKSQINLGPKSKMVINKFPKKKAGIITLLKGHLRSRVTKDYMDMDNKEKSKLFIKTKSAAMGVRGTDFQVNYNPKNYNTGLITFEGSVSMAKFSLKRGLLPKQDKLESIISGPKAVNVTKGKFSSVSPKASDRASLPVQINRSQLSVLQKNVTGLKFKSSKAKKVFKSSIPPGVDSTLFVNDSNSIDKQFEKKINSLEFIKINEEIKKTTSVIDVVASNRLEGGFIEINKIYYIAPPQDSPIDPNTGLAILPSNMGSINENGDWTHPNYKMMSDGTYEKKPERGPASQENEISPPPPPTENVEEPISIEGQDQDVVNILLPPPPPSGTPPEFEFGGKTRLRIEINAQ